MGPFSPHQDFFDFPSRTNSERQTTQHIYFNALIIWGTVGEEGEETKAPAATWCTLGKITQAKTLFVLSLSLQRKTSPQNTGCEKVPKRTIYKTLSN